MSAYIDQFGHARCAGLFWLATTVMGVRKESYMYLSALGYVFLHLHG